MRPVGIIDVHLGDGDRARGLLLTMVSRITPGSVYDSLDLQFLDWRRGALAQARVRRHDQHEHRHQQQQRNQSEQNPARQRAAAIRAGTAGSGRGCDRIVSAMASPSDPTRPRTHLSALDDLEHAIQPSSANSL